VSDRLDEQEVEAIAAALAPRVADLLRAEPFPTRGLVKVERVAELLDVDVSWVYEHKAELGAVRIGDGRGALRFEAAKILAYLRDRRLEAADPAPHPRPGPQRRRSHDGFELLPLPDGLR
jgi:hypothetical protein